MKITFLGTSHGVPDCDRYCQSIFVETGDSGYLFDAGAPVVDVLIRKQYDFTKLKAVFVTHMHGDHVDGLLGLADLSSWYLKKTSYDIFLPEKEGIICFENMLKMLYKGGNDFSPDRIRFNLMKGGLVFQNENIKVIAVSTGHIANANRPSYGYIIECEGKKVYISGDLDAKEIDYNEIVNRERIEAFIVECAHFMPDRLIEKLKSCIAKRVMLVHGYRPEIAGDFADFEKTKPPFELLYPNDGDKYIL